METNYIIERWNEIYAPNAAMLRLKLVQEGFRVFQWSDRAGRIYAQHKHEKDQLHWIISGVLELAVENYGVVTLKSGDRDFMPANIYHTAKVSGGEQVLHLVGKKI